MWEILGINPTTDLNEIKSAYARLAKRYNPEEYPEDFKRVFNAYKSACKYARGRRKILADKGEQPDFAASEGRTNIVESEDIPAESKAEKYDFSAVNTDLPEETGITDVQRERILLNAILEIVSEESKRNDIQLWKEFFARRELDIFLFDPIFRCEAYDILAEMRFSPETASVIASGFGRGSKAIPVTAEEWRVVIGRSAEKSAVRKKYGRKLNAADRFFILMTVSCLIIFLEFVIQTKFR